MQTNSEPQALDVDAATSVKTTDETTVVIEGASNVQQKYLPMTDLNNQSKVVDEVVKPRFANLSLVTPLIALMIAF